MKFSLYLTRVWFLYQLFLCWIVLADQIVYLDRPGNSPQLVPEPAFNPKTVTASVGDKIKFIARLENQQNFFHKNVESDYLKQKLTVGITAI